MKTNRSIIVSISAIALILIGIALFFPAKERQNGPKNIIYLIGDGMGFGQISTLIMEHAVNGEIYASSQMARIQNIGLDPAGDTLTSVLAEARDMGKSTGIVVNTAILDATPAAFYAHVQQRSQWEDIAMQLTQCKYDLLLGDGLKYFNQRSDSLDLTEVFTANGYAFFDSPDELSITQPADKLLALANFKEVLPGTVHKALTWLGQKDNPEGFFLVIEEARIDGHGHNNNVQGLIDEMEIMDQVMKVVLDYAEAHPETLVVITADHETGGVNIGYDGRPFFSTKGHSGTVVPVFAYGPGAENFTGLMDNTGIPERLRSLMAR
ncbi:MAG: alkaline phosphatase [Bacteroidales bacterium]|jgi:alkaline phosphatase